MSNESASDCASGQTIEVIPLRVAGSDVADCDGTVNTVVVRLTDSEGRTGTGESDASPEAVKAFLEMPIAHIWSRRAAEVLIGADPLEISALRAGGVSVSTRCQVDIALHDLAAKQLGVPAYKLMGGARRESRLHRRGRRMATGRGRCVLSLGAAAARGFRLQLRGPSRGVAPLTAARPFTPTPCRIPRHTADGLRS